MTTTQPCSLFETLRAALDSRYHCHNAIQEQNLAPGYEKFVIEVEYTVPNEILHPLILAHYKRQGIRAVSVGGLGFYLYREGRLVAIAALTNDCRNNGEILVTITPMPH